LPAPAASANTIGAWGEVSTYVPVQKPDIFFDSLKRKCHQSERFAGPVFAFPQRLNRKRIVCVAGQMEAAQAFYARILPSRRFARAV
jgi:hypothetical protein